MFLLTCRPLHSPLSKSRTLLSLVPGSIYNWILPSPSLILSIVEISLSLRTLLISVAVQHDLGLLLAKEKGVVY